jgi:hypothetical protein
MIKLYAIGTADAVQLSNLGLRLISQKVLLCGAKNKPAHHLGATVSMLMQPLKKLRCTLQSSHIHHGRVMQVEPRQSMSNC